MSLRVFDCSLSHNPLYICCQHPNILSRVVKLLPHSNPKHHQLVICLKVLELACVDVSGPGIYCPCMCTKIEVNNFIPNEVYKKIFDISPLKNYELPIFGRNYFTFNFWQIYVELCLIYFNIFLFMKSITAINVKDGFELWKFPPNLWYFGINSLYHIRNMSYSGLCHNICISPCHNICISPKPTIYGLVY